MSMSTSMNHTQDPSWFQSHLHHQCFSMGTLWGECLFLGWVCRAKLTIDLIIPIWHVWIRHQPLKWQNMVGSKWYPQLVTTFSEWVKVAKLDVFAGRMDHSHHLSHCYLLILMIGKLFVYWSNLHILELFLASCKWQLWWWVGKKLMLNYYNCLPLYQLSPQFHLSTKVGVCKQVGTRTY